MAYRKLPFGYEMRLGVIEINESEAALVRGIFEHYIASASYQQITEKLNTQPLPCCDAGVPWNKNMIGRILSDRRYLGEKGFPALVQLTLFEQAEACRPQPVEWPNETVLCVRRLGHCAHCGERLKYHGPERWSCPCCNQKGGTGKATNAPISALGWLWNGKRFFCWTVTRKDPCPSAWVIRSRNSTFCIRLSITDTFLNTDV